VDYEDGDMSDGLDYVYFDDGLSDYDDEYDRYANYFSETGNDPYGLFTDNQELNVIKRLKTRLWALRSLAARFLRWLHARPSAEIDDIPF